MVASSFVDVCRFNPTAGGTTDWTFSSIVIGYQSPSSAGAINGAQYSYRAESADLSQWEIGQGTYNSSTGVLTRTTALFSFTAGTPGTSKINFTTIPQVAITALAEDLSFLASGTGTVIRTLQAKARERVSVLDFGADPTGVADSTTAIQAAVNSLSTTGGDVFFPLGAFKTTAPINIPTAGISLQGVNRVGSRIVTTLTNNNVINITASSDVGIDSLGIVGTSGVVWTAGSAINATNCQSCKFTNILISDVFQGILLNNSTNTLVQFVHVIDIYGQNSIESANGGGDYIINNQLDTLTYGTTLYGPTSGFGAWTTSTAHVAGDVVSSNGGWFICQTAGTTAATGSGPVITGFNVLITDGTAKWFFMAATNSVGIFISGANSNFVAFNDISGPRSIGVQLTAASQSNIITGNTFGQTIGPGVQLGVNVTNTNISNNLFSGMYGPSALGASAVIDANGSASGTIVVNNTISGTGWFGIFLQTPASNWVVTGNAITGCGQTTSAYAIGVAANVTGFTIDNNVIAPSTGQTGPIQVAAGTSDHYNIIGNVIGTGVISDGGTGTHKIVMNEGASPALGAAVAASLLVNTPATGLGYSAGAGGAVTQATSKATGVTLNTPTGKITMNAAALASVTLVSFVLTNSVIAATDTLSVNLVSGNATVGTYNIWPEKATAGAVTICVRNISAGSLSEALVLQFNVHKGAIS